MSADDPKRQPEAKHDAFESEDHIVPEPSAEDHNDWLAEKLLQWHSKVPTGELNNPARNDKLLNDESSRIEVVPASNKSETDTEPQASDAIRAVIAHDVADIEPSDEKALAKSVDTPWTLQQFFDGQIDLDVELAKRFPNMPMMASIKFRTLGDKPHRRVATMTAQDGSASLIIDGDVRTKTIQMSFTFGSMLTLRFVFGNLNSNQRQRWMDMMQRDQGGLSFLWGSERWQEDYLVCISRKYFTNLYAFSPHNFEAGVRLTPTVMEKLLDWLQEIWLSDGFKDDEPPQLLTW